MVRWEQEQGSGVLLPGLGKACCSYVLLSWVGSGAASVSDLWLQLQLDGKENLREGSGLGQM